MKPKMYRTQILLEPEQHQALVEVARREGRSVSDVVRGYVQDALEESQASQDVAWARRMEAIERLIQRREALRATQPVDLADIDIVEEINRMREERDEEILGLRSRF